MYQIDYADPRHPQIIELLRKSHRLMDELFPNEANSYLELESLLDDKVHFFAAQYKIITTLPVAHLYFLMIMLKLNQCS